MRKFINPTRHSPQDWRIFSAATARVLLVCFLVWTLLVTIGATGNYSDIVRQGHSPCYLCIFWRWWRTHILLIFLSAGLFLVLQRRPSTIASARAVGIGYACWMLLSFPLQLTVDSYFFLVQSKPNADWAQTLTYIWTRDKFSWFMVFSFLTGTYIAVVAISTWHQAQARADALRQTQVTNLNLSLELEQQRLLALRAQLEPHFIFNALNAISALVRSDDKRVALTGIHRLSELLRYALVASSRDWVTLQDELNFVRDYLALQQLRYGNRLQIQISGDDAAVLAADCPPLLLQPLIENALRHDLDRHEGPSAITLDFQVVEDQLWIRINNQMVSGVAGNPGSGTGLPNTRARLQLAYQERAKLTAQQVDGQFVVTIQLPLHASD